MQKSPITKYRPFPQIDLPDRQWPSRTIQAAPTWCSVDLRDGNQALAIPMSVEQKLEFFNVLVGIGFKQIEVGFPAAAQVEFDFCRRLIEENRIPDDVSIQVLCQCREDLILRSLEALQGAQKIIFHLYNSTSPAQRSHVFGLGKADIIGVATRATAFLKEKAREMLPAGTDLRFEYSPESFSSTELDFALEICEAVTDVWQPTAENKIILNLPATVEYSTPNVHADQIEWMGRHLTRRDLSIISLHTHNDRGTGVAATELALLAGADRIEGTLFGNGERTGNVDLITVALNLYTQGIDPQLDFSDINGIRDVYERCTHLEVPPRQPYAGELVFTAFSGSHQDAIKKSWAVQKPDAPWDVLYIPIDPQDIGRNYRALIRINSQSGKGGVAYIMEKEFGFQLPKGMQKEFGKIINDFCDRTGQEITVPEVYEIFSNEFIERTEPLRLHDYTARPNGAEEGEKVVDCVATISLNGTRKKIEGRGNGPIAAFVQALSREDLPTFEILSYSEHSLGRGADSRAVSYIEIKTADGRTAYGAGIDTNIELASIKGVASALNRTVRPL